jgi:hypothetical protein
LFWQDDVGAACRVSRAVDSKLLNIANHGTHTTACRCEAGDTFDFLRDNIGLNGRNGLSTIAENLNEEDPPDEHNPANLQDENVDTTELTLSDDTAEMQTLPEEDRVITFQNQYNVELDRQVTIIKEETNVDPLASPLHSIVSEDDFTVCWEDVDG